MSQRRKPGEIVRRKPGSGFTGDADPEWVMVPLEPAYSEEADPCILGCGDPDCREWANLEITSGQFKGQTIYHISECELLD